MNLTNIPPELLRRIINLYCYSNLSVKDIAVRCSTTVELINHVIKPAPAGCISFIEEKRKCALKRTK